MKKIITPTQINSDNTITVDKKYRMSMNPDDYTKQDIEDSIWHQTDQIEFQTKIQNEMRGKIQKIEVTKAQYRKIREIMKDIRSRKEAEN